MIRVILLIGSLGLLTSDMPTDSLKSANDSIDYNSGICYDFNHAYYLAAAVGWKMDDIVASEMSSSAAFYPTAFTSNNSPVVVFTNFWFKNDSSLTIKDIINAYGQKFEEDYSGSRMEDFPSILTRNKTTALVRCFINDEQHVYQMIAFNDLPGGVIAIILSSYKKNDFENYIDGFREIAHSFVYITNNVRIEYPPDSTK